jgi:hypothetical protein
VTRSRLEAEAAFQHGLPWGWQRFKCHACGCDRCEKSRGLLHDPCPACGTHVGYITRSVVRYS